jgi:hypothetical protein
MATQTVDPTTSQVWLIGGGIASMAAAGQIPDTQGTTRCRNWFATAAMAR